jgi:hypothetical protein
VIFEIKCPTTEAVPGLLVVRRRGAGAAAAGVASGLFGLPNGLTGAEAGLVSAADAVTAFVVVTPTVLVTADVGLAVFFWVFDCVSVVAVSGAG